jgi:hypothetical protein
MSASVVYSAEQVVALLDVERRLREDAERRAQEDRWRADREHTLTAAFEMLGRSTERQNRGAGFTRQDAVEEWRRAGYGGLS